MEQINNILLKFEEVANNPEKEVEKFVSNGGKAIGMFPVYTPGEIVDAAGMLPVGIWGTNGIELNRAKEYFPAFCCSIMFSNMELALNGAYDKLSGVIIPGMCDTLNCIGQNWKVALKDIPYIALVHPQNRKLESGVTFLEEEYKRVKSEIEKIAGKEITEEELQNSIEIYNKHRKAMREFSELAASHPNTINNVQRSNVFKSCHFMKKEEHTKLVEELNEILKSLPVEDYAGKKVFVTGIILDSNPILNILEENNVRIVGDDLAHNMRQHRTDVPEGDNAINRLAKQWSDIEGCSLAYDPKRIRGKMIVDNAKELNADGVIYALMKFCDPEEYDAPITLKDIKNGGFPSISFEVDQQAVSEEQIRTRIQTFAEML